MSTKNYAFIKNNIVTNIAVFENETAEILNLFKNEYGLDDIILTDQDLQVGATYNGEYFINPSPGEEYIFNESLKKWILPKPFNSWILEGDNWVSPIPYPNDGYDYDWDEQSLSWSLQ